jgi:capsular polysaccharide biosynthesis protein
MENQQYIQEGEIDLKECIKVLIKRKKFVFVIFIVSVGIAALANLWIPKVYEVTSTIQLGSINELLIKEEEAKEIILNQNSLSSIIKKLNLKVGVEDLKKDITIRNVAGINLLKIDIIYPDINIAFKINEALADPLIIQGQIIYQEQLSLAEKWLKELDEVIKDIEKDINIEKIQVSGDIKVKNNLFMLWEQRKKLNSFIVNAKDFKIIDQPIELKNSIKRKKQKALIAGVITLLLGVFFIFFKEFYLGDKKGEVR